MQDNNSLAFKHLGFNRRPLRCLVDILGQMPVEVALGESRAAPGKRCQHLLGIARRLLIGLPDDRAERRSVVWLETWYLPSLGIRHRLHIQYPRITR